MYVFLVLLYHILIYVCTIILFCNYKMHTYLFKCISETAYCDKICCHYLHVTILCMFNLIWLYLFSLLYVFMIKSKFILLSF